MAAEGQIPSKSVRESVECDNAQTGGGSKRTLCAGAASSHLHCPMNPSPGLAATKTAHYELRFLNLFGSRGSYAFPCDAEGHVLIDALSDRCRSNYFYARTLVGNEFSSPTVAAVA